MSTRLVEVRQNVLKHNDQVARELRRRFHDAGVFVISLVSSPGSGKTAFLEKTLTTLQPGPIASPRWWATSPRKMTPLVWLVRRRR